MESNRLVWLGVFVGSLIGGYIPTIWGANFLSFSSIIWSSIGAFVGLYLGYKISRE